MPHEIRTSLPSPMYRIEKTPYGLKLTFGGQMNAVELQSWLEDARRTMVEMPGPFQVLVDMRDLSPLDEEAQKVFIRGQHTFRKAGMVRSAVVVRNPETRGQFERIARQSGIHVAERYFTVDADDDWDLDALAWLQATL